MDTPIGTSGKKGFRLLKFFAFSSFGVLIIFIFPFSAIISKNAKQLLLRSYENYALLLGQNLDHQIYQNFSLPVVYKYGQIRLRDEEQYNLMDRVVRNTIHSFKIDMVNIYDINKGVVAYSTEPQLVGKRVILGEGFKAATLGQKSSRLIKKGGDLWGVGVLIPERQVKLRTFLPFKGIDPMVGGQTYIMGVFELIQDLTEEYKELKTFQFAVFGISTAIMGLIFISLLLVVRRAENILEQQAQEQRKWEAKLNQSERLASMGRMVAAISHEIKNPLGVISSTAELLNQGELPQESLKELSGVIMEETRRLNHILSEFLDFARPKTLSLKKFDLKETLDQALNFLEPELKKYQISVERRISPQSFELEADENQVYRCIFNLLMNGIQAMEGGGRLTVALSSNGDVISLSIGDTGKGIPKEDLPKIFEPFYSTKRRGSGLGLPIVKNILDAHGGSISVESSEGKGTTVTIRLPRRQKE